VISLTFERLSAKQKQVFKWCYNNEYKALICDGSVRSGKTISMITSFVWWAMSEFNGATFGICGKTVQSAERNIIMPLESIIDITHYFNVKYISSTHCLDVSTSKKCNKFYIFGGKDESSYQLIQGITLSGVFFDEVALMPRSFVEQAITRTISVEKSKLWFNCNPDSSEHWFYKEWVLKAPERKALHLHFTMEDNPTLTKSQIEYAESQFSGVFYDRYIKGLWVLAEGLVYSMFNDSNILDSYSSSSALYYISCDYGIKNPTSMGLWALEFDKAVRIKEFYWDGRENQSKTDEELYQDLVNLAQGYNIQFVIVDPSASSFIECIKRHKKFRARKADNDVIQGISNTSTLIANKKLLVCKCCIDLLRELKLYRWDNKAEKDKVIKEHDHACDDMRYFVATAGLRLLKGGFNND
jgi:PBSX family phage terminase large subunit